MESAFSTKAALNNIHFSNTKCIHTHPFSQAQIVSQIPSLRYSSPLRSISSAASSVQNRSHRRLQCVSSSVASSGGGGGGVFGGDDGSSGGGGGGGGTSGGDPKGILGAGAADDLSALSSDVIILDVGGMSCGGCVASVKKILESQPQVSSATVDLTAETAIVWPVSEAKAVPNWQKELGEALAKQLTSCGFKSNLRGEEAIEL